MDVRTFGGENQSGEGGGGQEVRGQDGSCRWEVGEEGFSEDAERRRSGERREAVGTYQGKQGWSEVREG